MTLDDTGSALRETSCSPAMSSWSQHCGDGDASEEEEEANPDDGDCDDDGDRRRLAEDRAESSVFVESDFDRLDEHEPSSGDKFFQS